MKKGIIAAIVIVGVVVVVVLLLFLSIGTPTGNAVASSETTFYKCEDNDYMENYKDTTYVKGKVIRTQLPNGAEKVFEDYCKGASRLIEYYCTSEAAVKSTTPFCDCDDGACQK